MCSTEGSDWKWSTVAPEGDAPPDRTLHTATVIGDSLVIFGGTGLAASDELNDMYTLRKEGDSWAWSHPAESRPYVRHPDPGSAVMPEAAAVEGKAAPPPAPAKGEEGAAKADPDAPPPAEGGEGAEAAPADPPVESADSAEHAPYTQAKPEPVTARNSHAAVAIDWDLYVLGGDNAGDMMREFAM